MGKRRSTPETPATAQAVLTPAAAGVLPLLVSLVFASFTLLPMVRLNGRLAAAFAGAAALLLAWSVAQFIASRRQGRRLEIEVSLRPQHYVQAIAHTAIFVYWGFYWDELRHAAPLIAAQIVFAYAFDMLLTWARRDRYVLGFGPFPIIYSTNLFLRFIDDWFFLQFLMVAVGFLAKELIRWKRDGRRTHIFNPSSFPLALFSMLLIVTHTSHLTWAEDIASLLILPPHIYLFIFLVALPGQFMFRVTTMTLPAVLTTYGFSMLYLQLTGTYFFWDSNIPIAVFLGMHLLFTDPSTAPKTELGRIIFGVMYGASVVGLYALLGMLGAPTYYDKLLQVPVMNLMVRAIDRAAQSNALSWLSPQRIAPTLTLRARSFVYVSLWTVTFGVMSATKGLGDYHEGYTIPFWQKACSEDRRNACYNLGALLNSACTAQSGWACNELGVLIGSGRLNAAADPASLFTKACGYGEKAACENMKQLEANDRDFRHGEPTLADFQQVLKQGRGPIPEKTPFQIFDRACNEGWMTGCDGLSGVYFGGGADLLPDKARAAALALKACEGGIARSCSNLGLMYKKGDGVPQDTAKAVSYLEKSCSLGSADACRWLAEERRR